jgi:hypothetical protein
MRLALVLIFTLLSGCAESKSQTHDPSYWTEERKALYYQAREAGRQHRERYIAARRPALQLKFRHEYPTMTDEEINVLVNDALEAGLRQEAERRRPMPPIDCTSSQVGSSTYTNCY